MLLTEQRNVNNHSCKTWRLWWTRCSLRRFLLVEGTTKAGSTWLLQERGSVSQQSVLASRNCPAEEWRYEKLSPLRPLITLQ